MATGDAFEVLHVAGCYCAFEMNRMRGDGDVEILDALPFAFELGLDLPARATPGHPGPAQVVVRGGGAGAWHAAR
jgi:hypothetical protein